MQKAISIDIVNMPNTLESLSKSRYYDQQEVRTWRDVSVVTELFDEARNYHQNDLTDDIKLKKILENFIKSKNNYSDFDLIYDKLSTCLFIHGLSDYAFSCLSEGIKKSKRKCILFDSLAQFNWWEGNIEKAVSYWVVAGALQHESGNFIAHHSFINLAYIAKGLDLKQCAVSLLENVDRINPMRFNADFANERYSVAFQPNKDKIYNTINNYYMKYYAENRS